MAEFAIRIHGSEAYRENMRRAARNQRLIAQQAANGQTRGRIPTPDAMVARAQRCPSTVTLRITVGHSVATYRIAECISNVPRNVNCWVYPCGPTGAVHDNLLLTLDGREVGLRIGRDTGGLTRYITFEVYESNDAPPTSIFEGSGDCVVNAGGIAIPVRPRGIALGGFVTRL